MLKLNKNGIAYYYCHQNRAHPRIEGEYFTCNGHQKWGRVDSFTITMSYRKAANINAAPSSKVTENEPTDTATSEPAEPAVQEQPNVTSIADARRRDDDDPFNIWK